MLTVRIYPLVNLDGKGDGVDGSVGQGNGNTVLPVNGNILAGGYPLTAGNIDITA